MTITQTVDMPANRRLTIDVPSEVPAGPVVLAFTPAPDHGSVDHGSVDHGSDAKKPERPEMTAEEEEFVELAFQSFDAFEEDLKRATPEQLAILNKTTVTFNLADLASDRPSKEVSN